MGLALRKEPVPIETDINGTMRISGSRVTLDSVVAAFNAGATAEEIAFQYPTLKLPDIYAVITYYLRQQKDVDAYLLERRKLSKRNRQHNQARFGMIGVRERLLTRQEKPRKAEDA
ncbi:MAG: DUF433 domain-containing protein [Deltaproteobacteria bacterium]|nr:DUF433 domain-containing protein [Deltaproteobacteria bacterium]